ncbi:radical SAM protein [Peterkaempfera sp. SMS 1(5)a]|uniref:radical SAM protein n=1 Tax=Peterkaempfera podocarpi TaxID=3232308 RepID=UPI00366D3638
MHLSELLARRPVPASAVYLALTRRCPLHCRHCSTMSGPTAEQQPAELFQRFVETFSPSDHPEFLLLTGGEPLLRPGLVRTLAETARAAGTRTYLLTGAFFARGGTTPRPVRAALRAVDHVAVSIDAFHEAEVPRQQVFRVLHETLAAGRHASVQACGTGPDDPFLTALTRQVRAEFHDRVPMLVSTLQPVGRARSWLAGPDGSQSGPAARPEPPPRAAPCDLVSWPAIGFDGTIAACCNQDVLDQSPPPEHLRLGHIGSTTWPEVRSRSTSSPALRALRTRGPLQLAHRFAGPVRDRPVPADYCGTCRALSTPPGALERIEAEGSRATTMLFEQQAIALQLGAGPVGFARRHGDPSRAELVLLGSPGQAEGAVPCAT